MRPPFHVTELIQGTSDYCVFLEDLAEDLESTLCVIRWGDTSSNPCYIIDRQEHLKRRFGPWIDLVPYSEALVNVIAAYDLFLGMDPFDPPQDNQETAEDIISQFILSVDNPEYFEFSSAGSYLAHRDH